jgi:hypothetical protein
VDIQVQSRTTAEIRIKYEEYNMKRPVYVEINKQGVDV